MRPPTTYPPLFQPGFAVPPSTWPAVPAVPQLEVSKKNQTSQVKWVNQDKPVNLNKPVIPEVPVDQENPMTEEYQNPSNPTEPEHPVAQYPDLWFYPSYLSLIHI